MSESGFPQKSEIFVGVVPSCVAVAQGTLDPLAQVRIPARQPIKVIKLPDISRQMYEQKGTMGFLGFRST
jgi:hypothetical protein